jgi:hypothetical protein
MLNWDVKLARHSAEHSARHSFFLQHFHFGGIKKNTFSIYIVRGNPKKGSAYCLDVVRILHKVPENALWGFGDNMRT